MSRDAIDARTSLSRKLHYIYTGHVPLTQMNRSLFARDRNGFSRSGTQKRDEGVGVRSTPRVHTNTCLR